MDPGYWISATFAVLLGAIGVRTEETPRHAVLVEDGAYEIRRYEPWLAARTRVEGGMKASSSPAFRTLASYIFGANRARQPIAMTAPVVMEPPAAELIPMTAPVTMAPGTNSTEMRFMVPSRYTRETVPAPLDARVEIVEVPAEDLAVVRFSGTLSEEAVAECLRELRRWIAARSDYEAAGPYRVAGYDSPFTLPFMRRNEVMLPVKPRAPDATPPPATPAPSS